MSILNKDTLPKFISDENLVLFLDEYFRDEDLYPETDIALQQECRTLCELNVIEIVGNPPFYLGYQLTKVGKWLKEHGILT